MRFHPCLDKNTHVFIMRNCSHNLTPLDLIIQNYWIEALPEKEYMEYVDINYNFAEYNLPYLSVLYKAIYNNKKNTKKIKANKIKHFNYDRIMAGLISVKINNMNYNTTEHYFKVFDKLYNKMINNVSKENIFYQFNIDFLFSYGIDEAIIHFIFPNLRSGSYRHKYIKNPLGLKDETFALQLINGSTFTCHKCDKTKFDTTLDNTLGKVSINNDNIKQQYQQKQ